METKKLDDNLEEINIYKMPSPKIKLRSDEECLEARKILNPEQQERFDELIEFVQSDDRMYTLEGYAGTGKTFTLSRFVSCLLNPNKVAMTAPTNKAVKVLMENRSIEGIEFATIHSLLALTVKWTVNEKDEPIQELRQAYGKSPSISDYNIIILDEVSMLQDKLFHLLNEELGWCGAKVIFMGDPAQIPPIKEKSQDDDAYSMDAIPLTKKGREQYNIKHGLLTTVMRQANGSKILEIATAIRNNRFSNADLLSSYRQHLDSQCDVRIYPTSNQQKVNEFVEHLLTDFANPNFDDDPGYCKVIAWTNKVVNNMNDLIRKFLYRGQVLLPIMDNEKLIMDAPFIQDETILLHTSDEVNVIKKTISNEAYWLPATDQSEMFDKRQPDFTFEYYMTEVAYKTSLNGAVVHYNIPILTMVGQKTFSWALTKLKGRCQKNKKLWEHYFKLYEKFAKVKYNYAITCHKAQGSTYQKVYLMEDDIDKNKKYIERNRIKYTAISRPKLELHILSYNNR